MVSKREIRLLLAAAADDFEIFAFSCAPLFTRGMMMLA